MLFNSFPYAIFLPVVFLLYWIPFGKIGRANYQNIILLIASYIFYAVWDYRFTFLIAFTTLTSFLSGIFISKSESDTNRKKLICGLNVIINLAILVYFKYAGFFLDSFVAIISSFGIDVNVKTLDIILPVGISFYTFQSLGYSIDVFRGKVPPCKNPLEFFTFISFFPQLVAGPIERASNLLPQFNSTRNFNAHQAREGILLIIYGLAMKIIIADRLGVFVDKIYSDVNGSTPAAVSLAVIFFAFQLYLDFHSYSTIARGSAKLLGIELMLNFRRPYLSKSFKDFWKRWHISLSSWFADYIYIPLGGNRRGSARKIINTFIVFLLSGLWHGADWTFVAWGGVCALCLTIIDAPLKKMSGIKGINQVIIFILWSLSLVLFRSGSFSQATDIFAKIGFSGTSSLGNYGMTVSEVKFSIIALISLAILEMRLEHKGTKIIDRIVSRPAFFRIVYAVIAIMAIIIWGRYGVGNDSNFIYFQF